MKSISVRNRAAHSTRNADEILEMMGWADQRVKNARQLRCARCIPGLLTHPNRFRVESHSFTLCTVTPHTQHSSILFCTQHTHVHTPEKSSFQPLNLTILYISIVCMCSTLWQQQPADLSSRLQTTKVDLISIMSQQQQNQIFIKCCFLPNCDEM